MSRTTSHPHSGPESAVGWLGRLVGSADAGADAAGLDVAAGLDAAVGLDVAASVPSTVELGDVAGDEVAVADAAAVGLTVVVGVVGVDVGA